MVHLLSSEIQNVSLNGVQLLHNLHKLAVLKCMYAVDGGKAHWRHCAAYLNSGDVDRMIRYFNYRGPPFLSSAIFTTFLKS